MDTNDWRHTLSIDGMSSRRGHDRPTRGVFLFHDTHLRTINALPTLIDFLEASQCRFVTLSEYVGKPPLAGLKPQVAPVAAPSPADAALPHQFPADDGSDDLHQDKPAAPSNAAKSPNTATEVVLPLQRGDAPAVTSHPADKQPGADTSVQVTPSERQPSTNEPNRIPMTWAPAPLPPAPSSEANDARHTSGSTSQNEPASALPGTASTQSTPSGAIEPAPKTLSSPKTALPATSAQQMPTSSGGLQNTKAALNPSALSRQGVKPTPMQKTAPAQVTADPSAAPLQAPPSTSPLGPDRRTVTPSSPNTPLQQTGTVSPQSAVQAPSQPNQTAPSQSTKDSQDSGSFWKFFNLSL